MEKIMAIIAISLGKKATFYAVGRYYGFPKVYRRLCEFHRRISADRQKMKRRQDLVKGVFRFPNKIISIFSLRR